MGGALCGLAGLSMSVPQLTEEENDDEDGVNVGGKASVTNARGNA